tara:strand:- start:280 stop:867 length:588 start_codon:yes stop_codon:yes gene_type:complete
MSNFSKNFIKSIEIASEYLDINLIEEMVHQIKDIREKKGRIFFIGVGGSAGNCSHAVNDFRKLCNIECYAPTDNVSELTARINDDGWNESISAWLKVSNLNSNDALMVFSVGGGSIEKNVSMNLVQAIKFAQKKKSKIFGIVGPNGGYTKDKGDCVIVVPIKDDDLITPVAESFQAIIWHCLVSHPKLQQNSTKW